MLRQMICFLGFILISSLLCAESQSGQCIPAKKPDLNNDGIVDYKELWMVGRSFRLPKTDRRFIEKADTNCDGQVNDLDWDFVWQAYNRIYPILPEAHGYISINETPDKLFVGQEANFSSFVEVSSSKSPFTVKLSQQSTPNDGSFTENKSLHQVMNVKQSQYGHYTWKQKFPLHFKAKQAGKYQFAIRAEIPEDHNVIEKTAFIKVWPVKQPPLHIDFSVSSYYKILDSNHYPESDSFLYANLKLTGAGAATVEEIEIIDEENGYSYPGNESPKPIRIWIGLDFFQDKKCKSHHAVIHTPYGLVTSKSVKICGTPIPREALLQDCGLCHSTTPLRSPSLNPARHGINHPPHTM
jgi:hypothetical protein